MKLMQVMNEENIEETTPTNPYPSLAEMIRQQGEGEDTILAHINPREAQALDIMNGSSINPVTGLPQFGLLTNPKKWFKSVVGPAAGVVLGNMLLPGIGGVVGGAFGGAAGSMARGRNDMGQSALRGALMGAAAPTAASLAGSGASALGAKGVGASLSNYGTQNAILPSIGLGSSASTVAGGASTAGEVPVSEVVAKEATQNAAKEAANKSFLESLTDNTGKFLSKPKNLLTVASTAAALSNRPKAPKEKSPEQLAEEQKRFSLASMLNDDELAQQEAYMTKKEQAKRRINRRKFLPEEKLGDLEPIYARTNTPEEYRQQGRWINYYNNPQFTGAPLQMKEGGGVHSCSEQKPSMTISMRKTTQPFSLIEMITGGQDDNIPAMLSEGEYVIPADVVSHLGDGNTDSGTKKLDIFISNLRSDKGADEGLPPKAQSLRNYMQV